MVGPIFAGDDIGDVTNISPAITEGSSLGVIDGGNITPGIGLQVDVAAGTGYLMVGINPNDDLQYTSWGGQSVALPANQDNFLFINNACRVSDSSLYAITD